jgi:hypothetical protein
MLRRRWSIPIAVLALALGTALAMASGASAASTRGPQVSAARPGGGPHAFRPGGVMLRAHGAGATALRTKGDAEVASSNWSGYAATGSDGTFKSVSASWTQPTATCTSSTDEYAAFWVGLDGYSSSSVEQTGTDSDCDGTSPDYYGWYEMYPADPVYFTKKVKPGNSMSASVTFSGTDTYKLVLKNASRNWTETITKHESGLDRSSAEVITEAPSSELGVLPLADFGTVKYTASKDNGSSMGTQKPTEIVMQNVLGQDEDSTSTISSAGAFSNTWLRS